MAWVDLVTVLALAQYLFFGALVGRARGQYGVHAPATSGHPTFDRLYRVQMNTLELLLVFIPALQMAGRHVSARWAVGLGLVYLVGRLLYWRAYVADPSKRSTGFMLSMLPIMALLVAAAVGAVRTALR